MTAIALLQHPTPKRGRGRPRKPKLSKPINPDWPMNDVLAAIDRRRKAGHVETDAKIARMLVEIGTSEVGRPKTKRNRDKEARALAKRISATRARRRVK